MGQESNRSAGSVRYSATLTTRNHAKAIQVVSELGLDRLPDAKGQIRLLLWPEELPLLLERGIEVHLHRAIPVAPLNPRLVGTDKQVQADLERRLRGIRKAGA
jgi:hypothetical protein